jgi:Spy/CpxP family protein refolding chaperone
VRARAAGAGAPPDSFEEAGRIVDYWTGRLRSLGTELAHQIQSGRAPRGEAPGGWDRSALPAERPLITMMLHHQGELALTQEQVARLEALRAEFAREAIRREADIRIAELDLESLLGQEPVELGKVEAKVRELAQARAELRIARLRILEQGKAVLTPEQRTRFQALVEGRGASRRAADRPGTRL